jgi:hypothetical protein
MGSTADKKVVIVFILRFRAPLICAPVNQPVAAVDAQTPR